MIWEAEDVVKVAGGALFRQADRWAAWVVTNGRAELRQVETGRSNGLETEILAGLSPGETVVLHPSDRIEPGVALAPR